MSSEEKLNEILALKDNYLKKAKEDGEELVKSYCLEFLTVNPEIEAIRWNQYTPHFNDGDPCRFTVHEPYFKLRNGNGTDGDYEDGFMSPWEFRENKGFTELYKNFENTLNKMDDLLEIAFGDGVQITVTHDEIKIDEHEHD